MQADTITPSSADPSEEQLVVQFLAGHRPAGEELFRRCYQSLSRTTRRVLRHDAEAQDALHEGFIKALTRLHRFHGHSFLAWVRTIVYRTALEFIRKKKRKCRATVSLRSDEVYDRDPRIQRTLATPLDAMIAQEEEAAATVRDKTIDCSLVADATPAMRFVLTRRMLGWTYEQIAQELDCCEKTVRNIMVRLRAIVRREQAAIGS